MKLQGLQSKGVKKSKIEYFIEENNCFSCVKGKVTCKYCSFNINIRSKLGITPLKRHILTKKHLNKVKNKVNFLDQTNLDINFLEMMSKNNLSFNICDELTFKKFFKKLGYYVKSSSYYRTKLLDEQSKIRLKSVYNSFSNTPFYLMFDETMDRNRRSILNILIVKLNTKDYEKPKVIFSGEISNTKSETIFPIITNTIGPLLNFNFNKDSFKVLLTDGASYCRKLGNLLRDKYNCMHLICSCHNLHNFSEYVRNKYDVLDQLISFLKHILQKIKTIKNYGDL